MNISQPQNKTGLHGLSAWLVYNKVINNLVFCREFIHGNEDFAHDVSQILEMDDLDEVKKRLITMTLPKRSYKLPHECIAVFKQADQEKQKSLISEALIYSDLTDEEMIRLLAMHNDPNGAAYSQISVGNLKQSEMANMIISSLVECSRVHVDLSLVAKSELESLGKNRVNVNGEAAEILSRAPNMGVGELLSLARKKTLNKVGA